MKRIAALIVCLAMTAAATTVAAQAFRPGYGPPRGRYAGAPLYRPPPVYWGQPHRVFVAPNMPPGRPPNSLGAGWRYQQDEARMAVGRGQYTPLGRVIEGIDRRTPGRQLDAGIEYEGGRAVYRVRWITVHGRRIDYIVDAATGAILRGG